MTRREILEKFHCSIHPEDNSYDEQLDQALKDLKALDLTESEIRIKFSGFLISENCKNYIIKAIIKAREEKRE